MTVCKWVCDKHNKLEVMAEACPKCGRHECEHRARKIWLCSTDRRELRKAGRK